MASRKPQKPKHQAYCLEVVLDGIKPAIRRTIWVGSEMTVLNLHHILQAAIGWTDAHLHEFIINGKNYGLPDSEDMREIPVYDERRHKLAKLLEPHLQFTYWYDFGDDWMHSILVRETRVIDEPLGVAYVEAGTGACPPEDSGGVHGYQQFLDGLKRNPKSEEVKEFWAWAGEDFDPNRFDRLAANAALLRMAWNGWG